MFRSTTKRATTQLNFNTFQTTFKLPTTTSTISQRQISTQSTKFTSISPSTPQSSTSFYSKLIPKSNYQHLQQKRSISTQSKTTTSHSLSSSSQYSPSQYYYQSKLNSYQSILQHPKTTTIQRRTFIGGSDPGKAGPVPGSPNFTKEVIAKSTTSNDKPFLVAQLELFNDLKDLINKTQPTPEFQKMYPKLAVTDEVIMEMRYPGSGNAITQLREIHITELIKEDVLKQHRDAGNTIRLKALEAYYATLPKAKEALTKKADRTRKDPVTGIGYTHSEHNTMKQHAIGTSSAKMAIEYQHKQQKFYKDAKAKGLLKNTWWNRLWNSKEDILQARQSNLNANFNEHSESQPRSWRALLMMIGASIIFTIYLKWQDTQQMATTSVINYQTAGTLNLGGDFDGLVDQFGNEATSFQYRGYYPLYYFGFTKCPDICPTELHKMMSALDIVEEREPDLYRFVKPVFISVDPLRDTPAQIAAYAENFHPRMRWLTGSFEKLQEAAKQFHIYFSIPDDATPDGDYNVDHSIFFFLMDRRGKLLSYYGQNKTAEQIADALLGVVSEDLQRDDYNAALTARKQLELEQQQKKV